MKEILDGIRPRSESEVFCSWGIPLLDEKLGEMFCPMVIDITGPQDSGKSTMCYWLMSQVQREGGIAAYIHTDGNFDDNRARQMGLDPDQTLISMCPDGVEEVFDIAKTCVKQKFDIVVIDSMSALRLKDYPHQKPKNVNDAIYKYGRRVLSEVEYLKKTIFVITHQLHHKEGSSLYGGKEMSPYSELARRKATLRLVLDPRRFIKEDGKKVGMTVNIKSRRNLVNNVHIDDNINFYYDGGYHG